MSAVPDLSPNPQAFSTSDAAYEAMKAFLTSPEAVGLDHRSLEKEISVLGRETMRCLLQDPLNLRANDDLETFPAAPGVLS